jgi:hypothetical protein
MCRNPPPRSLLKDTVEGPNSAFELSDWSNPCGPNAIHVDRHLRKRMVAFGGLLRTANGQIATEQQNQLVRVQMIEAHSVSCQLGVLQRFRIGRAQSAGV